MRSYRLGRFTWALAVWLLVGGTYVVPASANDPAPDDGSMLELSLEDLLGMEVTSVSKRPQSLQDAAAAIYVITGDDIERMGVTNIPDALQRVPGLHVARIDANKWAVTSRGFNGRFSNKLLVLVDGRSIYTQTFSGVYWEVQDLMLEDIERIEIIRGPGSTLWGANAVNGVINIITKHAADTQGGLATGGAGDKVKGMAGLRWGTELSPGVFARFHGQGVARGEYVRPDGSPAGDDWQFATGGFRLDAQRTTQESVSLQGDIYNGAINQQAEIATLQPPYTQFIEKDEVAVVGGNVLARWDRSLSPGSALSFQVYYDRAVRREFIGTQATSQLDYDFQHQFTAGRQRIVWGLGYHYTDDVVKDSPVVTLASSERALMLYSGFFQDEFSIWGDRVALTLGSKIEHNDYTGLEIQPSARAMWQARKHHRVWAAVSRAVRTPMRAEDEISVLTAVMPPMSPLNPGPLPVGLLITGSEDFAAEDLLAYELGYRFAQDEVSVDLAGFYNDYTNLQSTEMGAIEVRYLETPPYIAQPIRFNNADAMVTYGFEAALTWQARTWLRWDLAYSYLTTENRGAAAAIGTEIVDPRHLVGLAAGVQVTPAIDLGGYLRYVDESAGRGTGVNSDRVIPAFTTLDAQFGWRLSERLKFSLVGRNLLEKSHLEYVAESFTRPTEVPRSFFAKMRWSF